LGDPLLREHDLVGVGDPDRARVERGAALRRHRCSISSARQPARRAGWVNSGYAAITKSYIQAATGGAFGPRGSDGAGSRRVTVLMRPPLTSTTTPGSGASPPSQASSHQRVIPASLSRELLFDVSRSVTRRVSSSD